ncbi:PadR family transcriptional regulator [Rhodoferax sp.]|uniref:PadR family transcriptional regulator n=1 Tax=Rhodoferax sp. TaxID=50421 RepID=UPI00374DF232
MRHFDEGFERGGRGGEHRGRGHGGGGGRVFGHGGLRLVLLQLIADKPRHGYELIKEIGDRLGGSYSPSPGVIYPTLTLLEELGYTTMDESGGGRKLYTITPAGQAFLAENRALADAMLARMQDTGSPPTGRPPQVVRALENFKMAVRLRLAGAELSEEQAHAFAQILDSAAQQLERI